MTYLLAETTCRSLAAPQFAVRRCQQAREVVAALRQLVEIFVMDSDIKKAYDYVSPKGFAEAAGKRGMRDVLTRS